MKVYHNLDEFSGIQKPVFTTGTFDGVHVGHQKILEQLQSEADKIGGESVLLTFHPHPRMVIFPDDHGLKLLNTQQEKIKMLQKTGLQHLIIHPFTKKFSRLSALEYVRDILVNKIGVHTAIIGYDHQFGKNREGNYEHLLELGQLYGFKVKEIPPQDIDNLKVSSTKVRNALNDGDVELAARFLTYPYSISGHVVSGQGIGKNLKFPTANIKTTDSNKLIPKNGVYIIEGSIGDSDIILQGMMNIGIRPTVEKNGIQTLEAHFLNWSEDIYGEYVHINLLNRMRDEKKFKNTDELKKQLTRDQIECEDFFGFRR